MCFGAYLQFDCFAHVMSQSFFTVSIWSVELWKKASMKHSFSVERPQIVENFIQKLMNGDEEKTDGQVRNNLLYPDKEIQSCSF